MEILLGADVWFHFLANFKRVNRCICVTAKTLVLIQLYVSLDAAKRSNSHRQPARFSEVPNLQT